MKPQEQFQIESLNDCWIVGGVKEFLMEFLEESVEEFPKKNLESRILQRISEEGPRCPAHSFPVLRLTERFLHFQHMYFEPIANHLHPIGPPSMNFAFNRMHKDCTKSKQQPRLLKQTHLP